VVSQSTTDSDERRDVHTQPAGASSSSSSAGARHKFRLLSSLPRAFFFDRRSSTKRRSSAADTTHRAAAAADAGGRRSKDDVDAATAHGPSYMLTSLGLTDTSVKWIKIKINNKKKKKFSSIL